MKTNGFEYEVKANVVFTGEELRKLRELSANHYDGVCKAASEVGGLVYGYINLYCLTNKLDKHPTTKKQWSKEVEIACSFRELDILAKIAEQENGYATFPGGKPILGDLGSQLHSILQGINAESQRIHEEELTQRSALTILS